MHTCGLLDFYLKSILLNLSNSLQKQLGRWGKLKVLFNSLQNFKNLRDFPSHRFFQRMHKVLNVAKQNN